MCNFISLSEKVKDIYKPPFLSEDGSAVSTLLQTINLKTF